MVIMKQSIFTTLLFVLIAVCNAQDIIVTTDSKKIEAKILEISETDVKYKELDNLEGPTFVLPTQKVVSIIYANGKVSLFQETASIDETNQNTEPEYGFLTRLGEKYTYQGRVMSSDVYANFLRDNCPSAFQVYHQGHIIAYSGWILLSAAIGMEIGSLIGVAIAGGDFSYAMPWMYCALGFTAASVPLFIVGYNKMHKSVDVFNQDCIHSNRTQSYWSIGASKNGIGLVLNF